MPIDLSMRCIEPPREPSQEADVYRITLDPGSITTFVIELPRLRQHVDAMRANLASRREQVLDARSAGRFNGTEPEPRAGLRGGHIPGSVNLPYETLHRADGTLRAPDELRSAFSSAGVDLARPIVTTCGSGVTASVLALGLHLLGRPDVAVYDGSWSEWGGRDDTPVER